MTVFHAPAPGLVQSVEAFSAMLGQDLGPLQGLALVPIEGRNDDPESVLVAPVAGTVIAIDADGVELKPDEQSPPLPSARVVSVRIVGGPEAKRKIMVAAGDSVAAGQQLLRWKTSSEGEPAYLLELVDPDGDVLCDLMEQEVYAAEPLLEIVGPRGEELSPVVALEPDGSVTPSNPQQASDLSAEGEAPGQELPAR